jgi:hypothetical protein
MDKGYYIAICCIAICVIVMIGDKFAPSTCQKEVRIMTEKCIYDGGDEEMCMDKAKELLIECRSEVIRRK